jgi:hypothetical protein
MEASFILITLWNFDINGVFEAGDQFGGHQDRRYRAQPRFVFDEML